MAAVPAVKVAPQAELLNKPQPLPVFTVATLPTAAQFPNHFISVTNGNAGASCLAYCDGINWWPVTLGTTSCAAS